MSELPIIVPDWPLPGGVHAAITTRSGGGSQSCFGAPQGGGLNLGDGTGDPVGAPRDPEVGRNRALLAGRLSCRPGWLRQVHGNRVHLWQAPYAPDDPSWHGLSPPQADAAVTQQPGLACAVLTADCLPVLLCDEAGQAVGAAHAGWRGLAAGVIEHAVQSLRGVLRQPSARILAYLGPAIGPCHFEVGPEVKAVMMQRWPQADVAFTPGLGDRSYADLYALARLSLASVGVEAVYGGTDCTHCRPERYFSYRRDGVTGRMASLIWRS